MHKQTANLITVARLLLAGPFVWLLILSADDGRGRWAAIAVFFVLASTDWVDGLIARRYNLVSPLGRVLDPAADKFVGLTCFLALAWVGQYGYYYAIPAWLVVLVIGKDAWLVTGYAVGRMFGTPVAVTPSVAGKVCTLCQFAFLGAVLVRPELQAAGLPAVVPVLLWLAAAATAIALLDYTWTGIRHLAAAELISG